MPIFLLAFLGLGFGRASIPGMPEGVSYIAYLTPGIIGMSMLFSSVFAGISVLWDIPDISAIRRVIPDRGTAFLAYPCLLHRPVNLRCGRFTRCIARRGSVGIFYTARFCNNHCNFYWHVECRFLFIRADRGGTVIKSLHLIMIQFRQGCSLEERKGRCDALQSNF